MVGTAVPPPTAPPPDLGSDLRARTARSAGGQNGRVRRSWRESRRWLAAYRDALARTDGIGVLVTGLDGAVRLRNGEATTLLGLPRDDAVPGAPTPDGLAAPVADLLTAARTRTDEPLLVGGRTLSVTQWPAQARGRTIGWVTVVRDRTEELSRLAELVAERETSSALRARAHEADNRLHTVVSLVELGHTRRAIDFATAVLARSNEVHESVRLTVADPVVAALLLGKATRADEAGVTLHVDPRTAVPSAGVSSQDLVLVLGNLVDNGIDAAASTPPPRWVHVLARTRPGRLRLEVSDSGPGLPPDQLHRAFHAGWTTKSRSDPGQAHGQGLGLALVASAVHRIGGTITVDRWIGARFVVDLPLPAAAGAGAHGNGVR